MKFGNVKDPSTINFSLPKSPDETYKLLQKHQDGTPFEAYVGCAKWNKADLKGFYPKGTKDELTYYSSQFNSIELNTTFYHTPSKEQVLRWKDKTPAHFKFFPKIPQSISHYSRLLNVTEKVKEFVDSTILFEEKLGMIFLQMHDNFKPKDIDRLADFMKNFPMEVPLAIEVRNEEWFDNAIISQQFHKLLEETGKTNIIVDTAGRRDMLHMRLTSPFAFVRYVGANAASDYTRLDEWINVLKSWKEAGLRKLYFFIHQNIEKESPLLAAYFIERINRELGLELHIPNKGGTPTLF